jgi:carbonic anhydrase/acetyltransferase-like protein (isoleucine patch superfamily)
VQVESGAVIGPYAVISSCSRIGALSVIEKSVVDGATVGSGCRISGAVICRNAVVPRESVVGPGGIIAAEGALNPPERRKSGKIGSRKAMSNRTEVPCKNRARLMRYLSESLVEFGADFSDGLLIKGRHGKVRISPAADRQAIVIETDSMENHLAADIAARSKNFEKRHRENA